MFWLNIFRFPLLLLTVCSLLAAMPATLEATAAAAEDDREGEASQEGGRKKRLPGRTRTKVRRRRANTSCKR